MFEAWQSNSTVRKKQILDDVSSKGFDFAHDVRLKAAYEVRWHTPITVMAGRL